VEFGGGYVAGSLAIMTDAAHLLSDLAGFVISLMAISVGRLPADAKMTYGFARAEVIGALISVLFIWALAAVLVVFAVYRLMVPEDVNGGLMFLLGAIGLAINLVIGSVLGHGHHGHAHGHGHDHGHGHSHGHSHSHTNGEGHAHAATNGETSVPGYGAVAQSDGDVESGTTGTESSSIGRMLDALLGNGITNVNVRAAYLHVLGDLLQNVGVLIAAALIWWRPSWRFADPLCTIFFAVIVMSTSYQLIGSTLNVLMEGTPPSIRLKDVCTALGRIPGVDAIGDLHAWSIGMNEVALSVHISTSTPENHGLLKDIESLLNNRFGINHTTIQVNCVEDTCCEDACDSWRSQKCFTRRLE